jgi:hypothetical protein
MATQGDRLQTTQKNQLHNANWEFVLGKIQRMRYSMRHVKKYADLKERK